MSFASAPVLLGLLVLPALAAWYVAVQRRRRATSAAFVTVALTPSLAPRRPGLRRHIPALIFLFALALLIIAAARPRVRVTVPVRAASVMLANDVSDSMTSADVRPSRLAAAQKAAITFTDKAVTTIAVGSVTFARRPTLLQSPTTDHALTREAISQIKPGGGGTAIGEAIETALAAIKAAPKVAGKLPPGAIVLLSDGTSNVGVSPITAAQAAKRQHVTIDTIAIGTAAGSMQGTRDGRKVTIPVPVSPSQLREIAATSSGTFYSAPDRASASAIYAHLAKQLGHRKADRGLIAWFAGAGLLATLIGAGLSLYWFGALA